MENIEKNEIITTEAIETITDEVPAEGNPLKVIGIIGLGVTGAALLTKYVFIPVGKKIIGEIKRRKAVLNVKNTETDEVELDDMDLGEIPEIDE